MTIGIGDQFHAGEVTAACLAVQAKQKMSEDEMEQLMDALEKMHHAELQKHPERWANLIGSPMPAK